MRTSKSMTSQQFATGLQNKPIDSGVSEKKSTDIILGPGKIPVRLKVNGEKYSINIEPRRTLLEALRIDLQLTGTKKVCNMGECGACTVMIDGKAVYSCLILAIECEGHEILTIEGLSDGEHLDPVQQAFIEQDAFQCGFCTSGQVISVRALLDRNTNPSQEDIRRAVSGNICRCGAYPRIFAAAQEAAKAYSKLRLKSTKRQYGKANKDSN